MYNVLVIEYFKEIMMRGNKNLQWKFFFYTFLWSWVLLFIPIAFRLNFEHPFTIIAYILGGIAPTSVGIILAYQKRDSVYWKDFWKRILNFKQISGLWYIIIFIIIPVTSFIAVLVNYLFTGSIPNFTTLTDYLFNPIQLITFAMFMFIFGPIPEEIGWRGFALDHLEKRYNWFFSSIILGFFWALWHLPMFFIKGTYQNGLLNESFLLFIDFNIAIYAQSIIMDWVYHNNKKSILSGVLIHFCINFFGELFNFPPKLMLLRTLIQVVIAVLILILWKNKSLKISKGSV